METDLPQTPLDSGVSLVRQARILTPGWSPQLDRESSLSCPACVPSRCGHRAVVGAGQAGGREQGGQESGQEGCQGPTGMVAQQLLRERHEELRVRGYRS